MSETKLPDLYDIFSGSLSIIWAIFAQIKDDFPKFYVRRFLDILGYFWPFWDHKAPETSKIY